MKLKRALPILALVVALWLVLGASATAQTEAPPAPDAGCDSVSTDACPPAQTFVSGGLGLDRSEWERLKGPPGRDLLGFIEYQNGALVVAFMNDRVWHIERMWGDRAPVVLDAARRESQSLIPSDTAFLQTYTASGDRTVDLYLSAGLASQFPADNWDGGEPGNFIVLYRIRPDRRVTSIVMGTGNHP